MFGSCSRRPVRSARSARSLVVTAVAAAIVAAGFSAAPATAEERRSESGSRPPAAEPGALANTDERYPGPYRDMSDARVVTISDLIELGERGGLEGPQDLRTETDPGVDPPYDPGQALDDLKAPWHPPVGLDNVTSPSPAPPRTGPGAASHAPATPFDRVRPVRKGCIGSKLVYRSTTGDWLPGFGWRVRVFLKNNEGNHVQHGLIELDSLGEWEFCPDSQNEIHRDLQYAYETANRLFELFDPRNGYNRPYYSPSYVGPNPPLPGGIVAATGVTPSSSEPGVLMKTKKIDTGAANFYGDNPNYIYALGDIMRWSMEAITTSLAFGIKVERKGTNPHRILYPNLSYPCLSEDEENDDIDDEPAWSCYSSSQPGRPMYLAFLSKHVERFTVQHELAHSIVDEYRPAGWDTDGGRHSLEDCTSSEELAYTEGFANFFAIWSHTPNRSVAPAPGGDHFNIESPSPNCPITVGETSEAWVAGALWDLHDHHLDGGDTLGAMGFGGVVKYFLNKPMEHILQFRANYLDLLSDGSKVWAKAVFKQNHIA